MGYARTAGKPSGFPIQVALLFWRFGTPIGVPLLIDVAFAPLVMRGMKLGLEIVRRDVQRLRIIVMIAPVLMSLLYILEPLI